MYTHLHVHTEYSLLDGLSRIEPLVQRAKELGMDSLAITDHGGLYGAINFYNAARSAGIKPIIGCEMYVAPGSRHDRRPDDKSPYHLTVLAKDLTGYQNLVKLVTASNLEGFYYKPRVDRELLERHHDGLVVLSGCPSGEVPRLLSQGLAEEAKSAAGWYKELFGDYYLELMEHGGIDELPAINNGLLELHRELQIPVVATNDSHYVLKEEAPLQDILICIHTNTNIHDEGRLKMDEDSYYLRSPEEMAALYPELPEAISNTQAIAEMCNLELDFSQQHLPHFESPGGVTADEYLVKISREGLSRRLPNASAEHEQRLTYELDVIEQTHFATYFLVAWDIARFARENKILTAVRGSAAASLVLYCMGVTDVDPLSYRLIFERFLNVERKQMPDIDMDFQDDRRGEVFNYVVSRYGRDHAAQIITFGTLGARASIRDVGRALAMPYADVDVVARQVPTRLNVTLDDALAESEEFREMYGADSEVKKLVDTARSMEGTTRHASTHAAGLVISDEPLDTYVPLQRPTKGDDQTITMTQYAMEPLRSLGLLQMDILGLSNLTILAKAVQLISERRGVEIALLDIPLDDATTFKMLSQGETVGVFQLEGSGMTRYIKDLKPSSLSDVAAMIALYRPGPMEHIDTFIAAKHGVTEPSYPHPALKDILEETYGVLVYQDQVLLIVQTFAGYSLGEADTVRRAMGKKIPTVMAQEREKFLAGALDQGYSQELADQMFGLVEPFAGYAFNKSHAVSYGLISYWTAYLKANYPEEYMVCLINANAGNTDKLAGAVAECQRLKIPVEPPDVNRSDVEFSVERREGGSSAVRFGLATIKNVGPAAVLPIVQAREKTGRFESIEQMCREADLSSLNRKALESLISAGALDEFGPRGGLLESAGRILALAQSEANLRASDQTSMFDLFGESVPTPMAHIEIPEIDTPLSQLQEWERELIGVDLSGSGQLQALASDADPNAIVSRGQIGAEQDGKQIMLTGQVSASIERLTRNQRPYTIATLALLDGQIDVFVWENVQGDTSGLWEVGTLVTVVGTVRNRGDRGVSISCVSASRYTALDQEQAEDGQPEDGQTASMHSQDMRDEPTTVAKVDGPSTSDRPQHAAFAANGAGGNGQSPEAAAPVSRSLTLLIRETGGARDDRRLLEGVSRLLLEHQGEDDVSLRIATGGRIVTLEWPLVKVDISDSLERQLKEMLGSAGAVTVEENGR